MATDIASLPSYEKSHSDYLGAKAAAQAAKDELAEMRAENEWLGTQMSLRDEAAQRDADAAAFSSAVEQAKRDYPLVPESVYASIKDPVQLLSVAKDIHEKAEEAAKAQNPGWGTAPVGTQSAATSRYSDRWKDPEFLREQTAAVKANKKGAVKEMKREIFQNQILPQAHKFGAFLEGKK